MVNTNQIKTGVVLSYIALFLGVGISLLYTPYMLRKLGQAEYGVFSLVNSTIAYLTILDFGFGNAIVRYTAKYRAENNIEKENSMHGMFLLLYIGIGILSFFLGFLLVFNVNNLFGKSLTISELQTAKVLMWLAVINIAFAFPFSIFGSIINAYERFVFARVANILRLILNPLLMVAVLIIGYKAIGMIVVITILNLVFNFINLIYCIKILKIKIKYSGFDISIFREISYYSFYIFLNMIVDRIYWSTGQFILGIFSGAAAISIFAIAIQINMYYMQLSTAASSVFLPKITTIGLEVGHLKRMSDIFIKVGRIQFAILSIALSGFIIFGKQFILIWAGPDYAESYYVVMCLIIPLTVPLIQNIGITILQAKNRIAFRSVLYTLIAIFNMILSIPLINKYGPMGAAMSTALSLTVGQIIVMNIYYHKTIKLNILKFWVEIAKMLPAIILAVGLEYIFIKIVEANGNVGYFRKILIFIVIYCVCMWLIGLNKYEKEIFLSPMRKFTGRLSRK